MAIALITGSSGLIGSEAVKFFHDKGFEIVGIDNNMRQYFFGAEGSTRWNTERLQKLCRNFTLHAIDIRNQEEIFALFQKHGQEIAVVIHTAAQPSHDWAAKEPFTDFSVNALGTMNVLEASRRFCPDAVFIFTSTNKVYGDTPNSLPLVEKETRWEVDETHPYCAHGIDEQMSIDQSKHSLFGVSKVAADVLVQEYGRYFGMKTAVFRGGCLTGPGHSGVELHGFLAYLARCVVSGRPYTIYGYKGKQVRDNIHSNDLINAFWCFFQKPRPGRVYNMGGSRHSNCSMIEAIRLTESISGKSLRYSIVESNRSGDHIWWISDVRRFQADYPEWRFQYDLRRTLEEIVQAAGERAP